MTERNLGVRVTVVGDEDSFVAHATAFDSGLGVSALSEPRLTEEAALVDCLTRLARALARRPAREEVAAVYE